MSWSLIRNALTFQRRQFVDTQRSVWTGEAWRDQRADFRLHLYQVAATCGVPFDGEQR